MPSCELGRRNFQHVIGSNMVLYQMGARHCIPVSMSRSFIAGLQLLMYTQQKMLITVLREVIRPAYMFTTSCIYSVYIVLLSLAWEMLS
jgi:hypothetical protein